jgi:hypothetical protein
MLHVARTALSVLLLAFTTVAPGLADAQEQRPPVLTLQDGRSVVQRPMPADTRVGALKFARTELYFGTARPDGVVTEAEFRHFVDRYVTPRFPDGLTLLKGDGQFRGEDGAVIKEQSFVLILLYPSDTFETSSRRIERIRTLYKQAFDQQSVLRVDDPFIVWVSF